MEVTQVQLSAWVLSEHGRFCQDCVQAMSLVAVAAAKEAEAVDGLIAARKEEAEAVDGLTAAGKGGAERISSSAVLGTVVAVCSLERFEHFWRD